MIQAIWTPWRSRARPPAARPRRRSREAPGAGGDATSRGAQEPELCGGHPHRRGCYAVGASAPEGWGVGLG